MKEYLQAAVTVLALVNPAICSAIFAQIESGQPRGAQVKDASKAAVAVLIVLGIAALAGAQVLHQFGVSLDAFSVAGGGVLAWMGFSMLRGGSAIPASSTANANATGSEKSPSLTPLILFAASPGTITGVITLAVAHTRLKLPVTALVAIGVAVGVMWLVIVLVARTGGARKNDGGGGGGGGFVRSLVTPFMGLIVIAMGVQFALTGLKAFFAGGS